MSASFGGRSSSGRKRMPSAIMREAAEDAAERKREAEAAATAAAAAAAAAATAQTPEPERKKRKITPKQRGADDEEAPAPTKAKAKASASSKGGRPAGKPARTAPSQRATKPARRTSEPVPNSETEDEQTSGDESPEEVDLGYRQEVDDEDGDAAMVHEDVESELNEVPDGSGADPSTVGGDGDDGEEWPAASSESSEESDPESDENLLAHLPSISTSHRSRSLPPSSVVLVLFQRVSHQRTEYWTFPYGHLTNPIANALCTLNGWGINAEDTLGTLDLLWGSREEEHIGWKNVEVIPAAVDGGAQVKAEATTTTTTQEVKLEKDDAAPADAVASPSESAAASADPTASDALAAAAAAPTSADEAAAVASDANVDPETSGASVAASPTASSPAPPADPSASTAPTATTRRVYFGQHTDWRRVAMQQFDPEQPGQKHDPINIMGHVAMAFQITFQ